MNQLILLVLLFVLFIYFGGKYVPLVLKKNKNLLLGVAGGLVLCSFFGMRIEGLCVELANQAHLDEITTKCGVGEGQYTPDECTNPGCAVEFMNFWDNCTDAEKASLAPELVSEFEDFYRKCRVSPNLPNIAFSGDPPAGGSTSSCTSDFQVRPIFLPTAEQRNNQRLGGPQDEVVVGAEPGVFPSTDMQELNKKCWGLMGGRTIYSPPGFGMGGFTTEEWSEVVGAFNAEPSWITYRSLFAGAECPKECADMYTSWWDQCITDNNNNPWSTRQDKVYLKSEMIDNMNDNYKKCGGQMTWQAGPPPPPAAPPAGGSGH